MSEPLDRYYRILGVSEESSKREIKQAYRKLALRYHPDKNPGNEARAAKIFTAINRAYSILIDKAHEGESFGNVEEAKLYFKRHFYDLARRINSSDYFSDDIQQEECDFFFRYQLEEVHCVKRSSLEARRIIELIKQAVMKGYNSSEIMEEHSEFFEKYGFEEQQECDELILEYRKILQEEPSNADAHCNLGILYEKRGMIDDAIKQYRKSLYIDPTNARARRATERLKRGSRIFH
jgi:tetratricopeptide (TPR) repeat protein